MMDNKLSELSKPVAEIKCHEDLSLSIVNVRDGFILGRHPVYSQEYVSALLAELEAKDKRIIGLERHVKDIEATLIAATDEVADLTKERDEARAKLATPVRLPPVQHREFLGLKIDSMDATQVRISIRAAGFTVEGDE